jgi:hypothetical protein
MSEPSNDAKYICSYGSHPSQTQVRIRRREPRTGMMLMLIGNYDHRCIVSVEGIGIPIPGVTLKHRHNHQPPTVPAGAGGAAKDVLRNGFFDFNPFGGGGLGKNNNFLDEQGVE